MAMEKLSHSYAVFWRHSECYFKHNVCLIGEAARTVHPTTAQGMNMAMLDAEVLAAVIKRCLVRDGISDNSLKAYESARRAAYQISARRYKQTGKRNAITFCKFSRGSRR
jgi:2-polyprenyl-6-methoxyphenol hydroxylase-like FAD-dependent oxidoreductase